MKSVAFDFRRAGSAEEACTLLAEHGGDAKLIAGGQSLVPMMAMRLARPAFLVDINDAADLQRIELGSDTVTLGAAVRQRRLERDATLAEKLPLLRKALRLVGQDTRQERPECEKGAEPYRD